MHKNRGETDLGVVGELSSDVECTVASESSPLVCSFLPSAVGGEGPLAVLDFPFASCFSTAAKGSASAADRCTIHIKESLAWLAIQIQYGKANLSCGYQTGLKLSQAVSLPSEQIEGTQIFASFFTWSISRITHWKPFLLVFNSSQGTQSQLCCFL